MRPHRIGRPLAAGGLVALGALLAGGVAAGAQEDPYGPTTTTTAPPPDASCQLVDTQVEAGGTVTGQVLGAPPGEVLQILFGGEVVGEVTVGEDGAATELSVTLPVTDQDPGALVLVGATVNVSCALDVVGVLGTEAERGPQAPPQGGGGGSGGAVSSGGTSADGGAVASGGTPRDTGSGSGSGGGALARTGENLPLLVGAGAVLLALGYLLVRRARPAR